jgi:hypothetical protein
MSGETILVVGDEPHIYEESSRTVRMVEEFAGPGSHRVGANDAGSAEIIEARGGRIGVESVERLGTRMTVTLPVSTPRFKS